MPPQNPDNGTQFIVAIFFIAVFVFLLMLIGVAIMALPQIRGRGKSTQTSSSELPAPSSEAAAPPEATSSASEAAPQTESTPPTALSDLTDTPREHGPELVEEAPSAAPTASETEPTPTSPLSERTETNPEQALEPVDEETWSIRQVLGVALTGVLIMAPVLVGFSIGAGGFLALLFLPLWTAAAGAIGLRAAKLSWQQTVLAAVLAGAALPVLGDFLGMWNLGGPYLVLLLFAELIWVSGGVFLLPLFDPVVRKTGPAPSTWKVVVTALALSAPFLAAYILQRTPNFGGSFILNVLVPAIPVLLSGILLAGGLILALFKPYAVIASRLGGVGILFACFMLFGGVGVEAVTSRLLG